MVGTGGKRMTASSNEAVEAMEFAENILAEVQNSHSPAVNVDKPNEDGESEDKVEIPVEKAENDGDEEMTDRLESEKATKVDNDGENVENDGCEEMTDGVESEKATKVDNDGENILVTEMNCDNMAESEQNTSGDDGKHGHEVLMREEEGDEENIADENEASEDDDDDDYEVSAEDASEEDDDDDDDYEVSAEDASEEEDDDKDEDNGEKATEVAKGNETDAKAKEDGTEAKKHDVVEADMKTGKTPNKRIRKKGLVGGPMKLESGDKPESSMKNMGKKKRVDSKKLESGDKPESSLKKKGKKKKRVESMGMIFMCSSKTKDDCFQYRVLGLPESKRDIVEKIYGGMRLFLYDLDLKLMYGIYKAAGPGGYNIEPKAFKSQFPSQVRFTVLDDCLPLPEEKFKKVIKENYFTKTKFDCQLKSEQVKKLCKLFVESSKGNLPKKSRRARKPEKPQLARQEISKRRRAVDDRHQEPRYREHPRKRPRHQPLPVHLPSTAPLYAYERPSDRHDQYNPYRDRVDPSPAILHDPYREVRDLYVERRELYRDSRDTYLRRPDPYVDGRISYIERRDPHIDGRSLHLEYRDPHSEPYGVGSYRRDPLLDRRDAYRVDGVGAGQYRDSYRSGGVLERGGVRAFDFETRYPSDIGSRDSYVLSRERPLYADPNYPGEYPSRGGGLAREYRL